MSTSSPAPARGRSHTLLMALAHAMSDFYATAFTPLVETFRSLLGLTVVGVSVIGALLGVFGSMMQPLMGLWSDRTDRGRMAAVGLAISAVFIGLIGLAGDVFVLAGLVAAGALGVAAFHPGAAVLAVRDERRRGAAIGWFMTGGGIGLALAPWVTTRIVAHVGLSWLWVIALPGAAMAVWLYVATRDEPRGAAPPPAVNWRGVFASGTGAAWALFALATVRSLTITAFGFYVSVLGKERGWSLTESGAALSWFLGCGVVGNMVGGSLADRMDRRVLIAASCVVAAPLFFIFAASRGAASVPAFAAAGAIFWLANPVNVSLAQELYPRNASLMSGVMMGLAWGVANLLLMGVGALAGLLGIEGALQAMAVCGGLSALFVVFLPGRRDGL